jgi:uncharacterized protein involved in exopolysaccharide biosynthesis
MTLRLLLQILRARFWIVALALLVSLGAAYALTSMEPDRYVAATSLVFSFQQDGPFQDSAIPAQLSSSYLATQVDIIRSQKVARKVVELEDLASDPGWRRAYAAAGVKGITIRDWIALQLMQNVEADPLDDNSRVVSIGYEAESPDLAARMANAYAQAFIVTTLELTMEPARRNAIWFDEQLKGMRARLDSARTRMIQAQAQKGVLTLDEKLGAESSRLDDLSRQLVEAQNETFAVRARQLGENHPDYVSAVQRQRSLEAALQAQKQSILTLNGRRDQLEMLAREVESEQQNYDATLQSYYKTAMESQFNQTNIGVLGAALPPDSPSSPNLVLNLASAAVLGLLVGLALALLAEGLNPRVVPRPEAIA